MATVLMIPLSITIDKPWLLTPSLEALLSITILGIFSTALAMIIYFRLVKTLGTLGVTSGSYLRAGFSVVLGIIFLGERVTPSLISGLIMILFGVAIVTQQVRLPFPFTGKASQKS